MSGVGKQNKAKKIKRAVDMSEEASSGPAWSRPPDAELVEDTIEVPLPDGDLATDKLIIRIVRHIETYAMVVFSLIQMTKNRNQWEEVAEVDTCHDVDVHVHQCGQRTGGRTGQPARLGLIETMDDVETAYNVGINHMNDYWVRQKDRWKHD